MKGIKMNSDLIITLFVIGWEKLCCFFGFHLPGEHCGEVKIRLLDGTTGEVDYGNVLRCPRCKKAIGLDNSH